MGFFIRDKAVFFFFFLTSSESEEPQKKSGAPHTVARVPPTPAQGSLYKIALA